MARTGCARTIASTGRYVPSTSSRAGPRRRAMYASHSMVAVSLQCRSSNTRTQGRVAVSTSIGLGELPQHALPRGPTAYRCSASYSTGDRSAGQLEQPARRLLAQQRHQLGPSGVRPICPSASRRGKYASPAPYCSMHWPCPSHRGAWSASWATKVSTSVVLPMPASPVMNPRWRSPWRALANHWCRVATSASRATSIAGVGADTGAGAAGTRAGAGRGRRASPGLSPGRATPPWSPARQSDSLADAPWQSTVALSLSPQRLTQFVHAGLQHPSPTAVSGQMASRRASLVTNWPACVTR